MWGGGERRVRGRYATEHKCNGFWQLTVPAMAASERALAASFPEKVAPSILAKYFCLVKHPAKKKLEIGDVWTGRYISRPAVAS